MSVVRHKSMSVIVAVALAVMVLPQSVLGVNLTGAVPSANPDAYATSSDAPVVPLTASAPGVLANDGGGGLTAVLATPPAHATSFTLNANGSFSYTPVVAFVGTDTFTYKAHNAAGDSPPATVTITLTHTNKPPVLTAGGTLAYTEQGPAAAIDTTITVNDPDNPTLAAATATISANYQTGSDTLAFTNTAGMGNIAGSFDATSGKLTLTSTGATATLAEWQTALRAVTYANASDNPTNYGANPSRTVTWQVDDGSAASNLSNQPTSTVNIIAVNDAPTVTAGGTLAYTEGDPPKAIDPTVVVNDVDNQNLTGATVQITGNYQNGQDVLAFATLGPISGTFNAASGTLTLTGTDTIANWRTALRAVTYQNTSTNPDTGNRTVTWIVNDGSATNNLSAPVTSTITVTPVNNAPTVTAGGTLNYTENGAAAAIDTTITVADADSPNLAAATISITAGFFAGDDLVFTNTATITGTYNSATGVLSLTGNDTPANYQAALRSVQFRSTSDNPTNYGANPTRTVQWIVNDGTSNSNGAATSTINVTAVNDAPALTAGGTLAYTEGQAATAIDATITVNDPDSQNLASATVQITGNYQNGQDILAFANTATITGAFTAATGTLTLTGTDTLANYQAALRAVTYQNTSQNPNTGNRTVTWQVNDGAAANNLSNQPTSTITVAAVNNAPVVTAGATLAYTENDPATIIDTTITITDADSTNLTGATVSITGNFAAGQDLLGFANTPNITGSYNAATGVFTLTGTDTVANYQAALRTVTYQNTSDDPSTLARSVAWVVTDGTTPSISVTSTVTVAAVNDAPTLTAGGTLNYTENQAATAIDTTITITDPDSTTLAGATVTISAGYVNGEDVLSFTNTATITGSFNAPTGVFTLTGTDTVANYQAALRAVAYSNTSDNPTIAARTVTWRVNDGAAANNLSNQPTSTVNVAAVNDAPALTAGGTLNYTENDPAAVIDTTITITDPDSANLTGATVSITGGFQSGSDVLAFANTATITGSYNIPTGVLTLTGTDTLANYQAALRSVTFNSTSDDPTAGGTKPTRTITWQVNDGAAANNLSNQPTSTVNITAVNDPPVLTAGATLNYVAGQAATAIDTTITITDPDSTTLTGATVTISAGLVSAEDELAFTNTATITGSYNSGTGVLTLTGTDTLANYQAALRSVTYHDTATTPNTATRTVTWQVNDGAAANNLSNQPTSTITVQINQAPTLTVSGTLAYTENQAATALNPTLTISDSDSPNMAGATVQITTGYVNGEDVLGFTTQNGITGSFNPGTGTLTLTGSATQANYVTALKSVTYQNTSDNPSTAARTVVWQVDDGAAANHLSNTQTSTINVTAVNDPPVVTSHTASFTFTEGDPATVIDPAMTVSDVDNTTLALANIEIVGNYQSGADVLSFAPGAADVGNISASFNAGTGTLTLTSSPQTATLAQWQNALRAVTYQNTSDNPSTSDRLITTQVNDGTAFASAAAATTVHIVAVNDAPTVTAGGSLTYTENDPATNIDTTITVTDPDNTTLASATVQITGNFVSAEDTLSFTNTATITAGAFNTTTGTLTLTGSDTLANWQTALRNVKYSNSSDNPSNALRTVTWQVNDGQSANNLSNQPTSTITVIPVNDAPTITNSTITYATAGNTQLQVAGATLPGVAAVTDSTSAASKAGPFTDPDGPSTPSIVAASGTSANGGSFSIAADGSFTYVPAAGFTGTDSFTYQVTDGVTPTTGTISITVGQRVWYVRDIVDANNPAGGDGRSNNAFDSIAALNAATTNNGDIIFIFRGNTGTTPLSGSVTLKDGQKLWGEDIGLTVAPFGTLVPAGLVPFLQSTAASTPAVSIPATAGNRNNVEVRGLNLKTTGATSNAIDVTSSGTNTVGVTISNNTISGATGKGINLSEGGSGAFTATLDSNALTATGNGFDASTTAGAGTLTLSFTNNSALSGATGINVNGVAGGTTWITNFANNTVSQNNVGTGIAINTAKFDATPGGAYQQVSGGTTVIGASGVGNGVGGSGMVLTSVSGDLAFTDLDIFADNGTAFRLTGTGSVNTGTGSGTRVTVGAGVAIFQATGGPAVDVTNATIDLQLNSLSSTNSTTTGVNLDTAVDGTTAATFSAGSGSSISGTNTTAFRVNASNATISYAGTISSVTAGSGVSLTTNTNATIDFTGALTLSTGANSAFAATGGGTVTATNTTSTLSTTSGTALTVTSTTIGAAGLTFKSIDAGTSGTPTNGILLNSTGSGPLTVSGNGASSGSDTTRGRTAGNQGSGGTIQNATGAGVSMTNTGDVTLRNMNIQNNGNDGIVVSTATSLTLDNVLDTGHASHHGLHATALGGLTLAHVDIGNNATAVGTEASDIWNIRMDNLTGTASVTNSKFDTSRENIFGLVETGSSTLSMSVTNCLYQRANISGVGNDGISIDASGTANISLNVQDSTFLGFWGDGIQYTGSNNSGGGTITVNNSVFDSFTNNQPTNNGSEVNIAHQGASKTLTVNVTNNQMRQTNGGNLSAVAILVGSAGNATTTINAKVTGNLIGNNAVTDSGSFQGNGIVLEARTGIMNALLSGNTVRQVRQDYAVWLKGGIQADGALNPVMNVTVTGSNDFKVDPTATNALAGLGITMGTGAFTGDSAIACLNMAGNTAFVANISAPPANQYFTGLDLTALGSAVVSLQGYTGSPNAVTGPNNINTFLQTTATTINPTAVVTIGTGGAIVKSASSNCATPP